MLVEGAICTHLLSVSAITALCGTDIYRGRCPQSLDWSTPVIRVAQTSGMPTYTLDGEAGVGEAKLQIDCYGPTFPSAESVAALVRSEFSAANGTYGGLAIRYANLTDARSFLEPPDDGSDKWTPRVILSFDIRYVG